MVLHPVQELPDEVEDVVCAVSDVGSSRKLLLSLLGLPATLVGWLHGMVLCVGGVRRVRLPGQICGAGVRPGSPLSVLVGQDSLRRLELEGRRGRLGRVQARQVVLTGGPLRSLPGELARL